MHTGIPWGEDSAAGKSLVGRRVLLVEDEAILAVALQAMLEDAGAYVVGPASSLKQAALLVERETLSAALLDITVGGQRIWPIAQMLKERGIPILFYTGWHNALAQVGEWPQSRVVAKPAPDSAILGALADLTRSGGEARARRPAKANEPPPKAPLRR